MADREGINCGIHEQSKRLGDTKIKAKPNGALKLSSMLRYKYARM